jgi:hypothetical protein
MNSAEFIWFTGGVRGLMCESEMSDSMMTSSRYSGRRDRYDVGIAAIALLTPGTCYAHDTGNLLMAIGVIFAIPAVPLWIMLRPVAFAAALALLWAGAVLLVMIEDQISHVLGISVQSGVYSTLLLLSPVPVCIVYLIARRVRALRSK